MNITFYSFVMAVITSSILILLIYFITKSKRLDKHLGLTSIIILYICSIVRLLIPIEFPQNQIIISDRVIFSLFSHFLYSPVIDNRETEFEPINGFTYLNVIVLVITIVSVALLCRQLYKYIRFKKHISTYTNLATNRESDLFYRTLKELKIKRKVKLLVIDECITPITYGVIKPIVLMPCNDYDDKELSFIFRHELNHQKNMDILLKLLVEIYCCLFWWNPLVYLLRANLSQKLELKCDSKTNLNSTNDENLAYLSTILKCMRNNNKKDKELNNKFGVKCSLVSSEFASAGNDKFIKERFEFILENKDTKTFGRVANIVFAIICAAIIIVSYMFIWQPSGGDYVPPDAYQEDGKNWVLSNASNSYLVKQEDGNYLFYFGDFDRPLHIAKEDVEAGLYDCYPIKD
ncbi:MAG: M56 family metallopeptidase [Acutalibacteraceae bacterium]